MGSKRNVHHSRATASLDEENDSDSDSDDEPERVGHKVKIILSIKIIDNNIYRFLKKNLLIL